VQTDRVNNIKYYIPTARAGEKKLKIAGASWRRAAQARSGPQRGLG
jgi:hypothetical protein